MLNSFAFIGSPLKRKSGEHNTLVSVFFKRRIRRFHGGLCYTKVPIIIQKKADNIDKKFHQDPGYEEQVWKGQTRFFTDAGIQSEILLFKRELGITV